MSNQPTVREINSHLASMTGYCMVYGDGFQMRINRARSRNGLAEGRVVNGHGPNWRERSNLISQRWERIPIAATVELS